MLTILNQAVLDAFDINRVDNEFIFTNRQTGRKIKKTFAEIENSSNLHAVLACHYYPNSVLILTDYLTKGQVILGEHFNYRGLKFIAFSDSYFKYEEKPNIVFGEDFYFIRCSVLCGSFNRRYFDTLIDKILPLLKNEKDAFSSFSEYFTPDLKLKGYFTQINNTLSSQNLGLFSSSRTIHVNADIDELQGKILIGESGIEVLDPSFIDSNGEYSKALNLDKFISSPPVEELTTPSLLPYNEVNFQNCFLETVCL